MRAKREYLISKSRLLFITALVFTASLTLAISLNNIASAAVGGPTCTVGSGQDYATIQAAVDVPGCTTIKVKPGTYNESVNVHRSVKIKGAKAGDQVQYRTFGSGSESTVDGSTPGQATFTINAADVTLDGFSITNPGEGLGILVKTAGNNVKIKNNIVDGIGGVGFLNHTVGIYLEYGPDNVQVKGNKVTNLKSDNLVSPGTAQGVLVGDSTSADPSLDIELDSNIITNIQSTARGAYGIQVNNGSSTSPTATGYTEVKIRGNTINDLSGGWVHAIGLEGETPNAVVRYNKISNLNSAGADKIGVFFQANQFFFTANVNRNSLDVSPTAAGIAVHPTLTAAYPSLQVDGECNWWGDKSGPGAIASGIGSLVGPSVDYSPWLKSSNLDGRCGDRHDESDDDDHHGDKNCKKDDRRGWRYND